MNSFTEHFIVLQSFSFRVLYLICFPVLSSFDSMVVFLLFIYPRVSLFCVSVHVFVSSIFFCAHFLHKSIKYSAHTEYIKCTNAFHMLKTSLCSISDCFNYTFFLLILIGKLMHTKNKKLERRTTKKN